MSAIKITKVTDYIGNYHILSGDRKSWDGICVYQSGRPVRQWVCYPHGYQAHGPKLTVSARWSFLLCQDGVSLACSFPPSLALKAHDAAMCSLNFLRNYKEI